MSHVSYVPGTAHAVVTYPVTVLVTEASAETLAGLWQVATTAPDVMGLLDVLGSAGFAAMPAFAATVRAGADLRVVTRGSGQVRVTLVDGEVACDAAGVSTWSEQRFPADQVTGLSVSVGSITGEPALPIVAGVVRASEVIDGITATAVDTRAQVAEPQPTESEPEAEPKVEPEPYPTPAPTPVVAPVVAPDPASTMVEPDEASFDALFGATIAGRRPEDAAVREAEDLPAPETDAFVTPPPAALAVPPAFASTPAPDLGDHDHHTMTPEEFARLRATGRADAPSSSSLIAPPPLVTQAPAPRVVLTLSTGREIVMDRPVLIGRSPQARNTSSTQLPLLVVIDDPYVSGTHLDLTLIDGQLRATDVSTNGTLLRLEAGAPAAPLVKEQATPVPDGAVLVISDHVTVTVSMQ